jgi:hypothetical protein
MGRYPVLKTGVPMAARHAANEALEEARGYLLKD